MSSRVLSLLWADRLSITITCPDQRVGTRICSMYASKTALVVPPSTARHGPIPSAVMLAKSVVFLPRFLPRLAVLLQRRFGTRFQLLPQGFLLLGTPQNIDRLGSTTYS